MFPNHYHQSPPNSTVNHHLTTTTSDETDIKKEPNTTNESESINIVRRSRGRPPGSKNKSKSPVTNLTCVANKPDKGTLAPYVLEVSGGSDIVAAVRRFCNHRKIGLCVLNGSGAVSNVSFRQPTTTAVYHGCFNLVSISATILPPLAPSSINGDFLANFVISLSCPQGRTFGGTVVGPLIAAGTVYIVAAAFNNPIYHRLPMEEDNNMIRNGGHASVSAAIDHQASGSSGGENGHHYHHAVPLTMAGMLSAYPGEIWAPTPRQSQPHSSLYN
ncbi:hypothetical protein QVD17_01210 [Tagetes erecta]|uniref:AT-hook motif nuclear-localized protein n=1 Tax=Tagetes erecta TaxID=13708 RepID=A0AAD8LBQ1_TARER|nr:hypothetical protein QVD17_01210 [Tagetes erecta]